MDNSVDFKRIVRPLYDWEILEARTVFGAGLRYELVRIHECATWTDAIDRLGRRLKRMPPSNAHNALTLGNHCYFPVRLVERPVSLGHPQSYQMGWLIHELTHAWQYQQLGWRYLWLALSAQFRHKGAAYEFDGSEGLSKRSIEQWSLSNFNLEQQGEIARTYYEAVLHGKEISAWRPYVDEFQKPV